MLKQLNLNDDAPWKARFRAPIILWARIAENNPVRGLVCTNKDGVYQLYAWEVESGKLTLLTDQPTGIVGGAISADGTSVYYHHDEGGNEIGHYVRVPFEDGEPEDITPDMPPYASFFITQSKAGNVTGYVAAGAEGFQIYTITGGGESKLLCQSEKMRTGPYLSHSGEISIVTSTERSGTLDASLLAFDTETGEQIAELWDGDETSISPDTFSPLVGDVRMLASTSKSGFNRPLVWNPSTGERKDLAIDNIPGDVEPWGWSPDGKRVLLRQLYRAEYQLHIYNLNDDSVTKLNHPPGVFGGYFGGYFTEAVEIFTTWQDSTQPSRLVALDGETGEQIRTVLSAGDAPAGRRWKSVSFPSSDGTEIQAWVATPEGEGPFPTILHTHGGPTAVMTEVFEPLAQTWLDHGFAFISVNYRGSTTFGKDFEKAIWGKLGHLEVDDMAAAHQWIVDEGIADPDAILVTGGSYGGYLTLQSMGRRPELFAGGMGEVAIADWTLLYEGEAETLRGYQRALFGGSPEEKQEAHKSASPLTYAENIRAPLLVIQGKNDTRCPSYQMEVYEEKLNSLNKQIQVHWFDAGHGSRAQEQQIEHLELMLRFAYRVLG